MRPKYQQAGPNQRDRWMVSYVDILTVLLIFFMVGAAKSLEIKPAKAVPPVQPVIVPVAAPVQPPKPAPEPEPNRGNLIRAQELLKEQGLDLKLEPRGLVISLPQVILFASGESAVSPRALPTIAQIAEVLRDIPNDVTLVGHADAIPIHNRHFGSNWELSMARSHKILELLSGRYGISESRLSIASYGSNRPATANDSAEGRASNRRVEIVILDESHSVGPQVD